MQKNSSASLADLKTSGNSLSRLIVDRYTAQEVATAGLISQHNAAEARADEFRRSQSDASASLIRLHEEEVVRAKEFRVQQTEATASLASQHNEAESRAEEFREERRRRWADEKKAAEAAELKRAELAESLKNMDQLLVHCDESIAELVKKQTALPILDAVQGLQRSILSIGAMLGATGSHHASLHNLDGREDADRNEDEEQGNKMDARLYSDVAKSPPKAATIVPSIGPSSSLNSASTPSATAAVKARRQTQQVLSLGSQKKHGEQC